MCKFFSFVTVGSKKYYFNWQDRQKLLQSNPENYEPDSHSSIAKFFNIDEDKCNKFEFNPIIKEFLVDQINIKDNQALAKKWVEKLNFKKVIEPLIIHEIVHPFKITPPEITERHIELLKQWASVGDSVGDSVWDSVRDFVWTSVWAYISSYFDLKIWECIEHEKGKNPFQPCIDLWNEGLVPSFDGEVWRLHGGEKAEILYTWNKNE